jgi:hypothetical protein
LEKSTSYEALHYVVSANLLSSSSACGAVLCYGASEKVGELVSHSVNPTYPELVFKILRFASLKFFNIM